MATANAHVNTHAVDDAGDERPGEDGLVDVDVDVDVVDVVAVDVLAQLSFTVQALLERRAGEHDVSFTVTRLLGILRDRTPAINELAALLELDKSSVSGLVDRAARRGYVERMPALDDRRSVRVGLTDAGRALAADVATEFGRDVTALLAALDGDERARLTSLAQTVLEARRRRIAPDAPR